MSLYDYLYFYGSLYECPYRRRLSDCPVKPLENKPFTVKYEWFHSLAKEDKDLIVAHHKQCSGKRAPANQLKSKSF